MEIGLVTPVSFGRPRIGDDTLDAPRVEVVAVHLELGHRRNVRPVDDGDAWQLTAAEPAAEGAATTEVASQDTAETEPAPDSPATTEPAPEAEEPAARGPETVEPVSEDAGATEPSSESATAYSEPPKPT